MRTENIKITFSIPLPINKPDLNGVMYSKEAFENAVKNINNIPLEIRNDNGDYIPIGVCQEAELIHDSDGLKFCGVGLVFYGGTEESVEIVNGIVKNMRITDVGIASK